MNKLVIVLVLAGLVGLVGCEVVPSQTMIEGSGNVASEIRAVEGFDQINVEGDITVIYKKSTTLSVKITAQENLLPYIETSTNGTLLTLKTRDGYSLQPSNNTSIVVRVSSPNVSGLSLVGSGLLSADTLVGDAMTTYLDGSGTVAVGVAKGKKLTSALMGSGRQELMGELTTLDCSLDGSGTYKLEGKAVSLNVNIKNSGLVDGLDFLGQSTVVGINGSGVCKVSVGSLLNVKINGSGSVMYKGNAQVSKVIEGSGTVQQIN